MNSTEHSLVKCNSNIEIFNKRIFFLGHFKPDHRFDIDLNNPIHVNMGMEPVQYPQNSFRMGTNDYLNYA
jgi:hypothetical protein